MNRIWRDVIGAAIIAGAIFAYLGLLLNDTVGQLGGVAILGKPPLAEGPQGMAVVGLVAAGVLFALLGLDAMSSRPRRTGGVALIAAALGVAAVVTADWTVLAVFIGAVVVMWAVYAARDVAAEVVAHGNRTRSTHA